MSLNVETGRSPRDGQQRLPRATVTEHDITTARSSLRTLRMMNTATDVALTSQVAAGKTASLVGETVGRTYGLMRMLTLPHLRPLVDAHETLVQDLFIKPTQDMGKAAETFTEEREIGVTPKTEIAHHGIAKLYHYENATPPETDTQKHKEPLLLIFARMNRPQIQDLAKQKSYVEEMINKGYDVYSLDWGDLKKDDPDYQREITKDMGDDVLHTMPHLIDAMKQHSGAKEFDMQGWCQGAVLVSMYAALQPDIQPDAGLRKIVLLTPPLDYPEDAGPLAAMVRDDKVNLAAIVEANGGSMPGDAIDMGAKMRNFGKYVLGPYMAALKVVDNERARENMILMQNWMKDLTDMPGPWYLQFIEEMYKNNNLTQGKVNLTDHQSGEVHNVDLDDVSIPVLVVGAELDDIAPRQQWINAKDYFANSPDVQVVEIKDAGHIGLMTGKKAKQTWDTIDTFLQPTPEVAPEQETYVKTYEVTEEKVSKLASLLNTSESVARMLLPLGFHSAALAAFSDETAVGIYAQHTSTGLVAGENGQLQIQETVERDGNKLTISYTHSQANAEIGKGTDKLILVPQGPQEQTTVTAKKPKERPALPDSEDDTKTITCASYMPTQADINAYADITGDYNAIHVNEKRARETMFHSTIAHGMLIAGRAIAESIKAVGQDLTLADIAMHFTAPVRPGDTIIPSLIKLDVPGEKYEWIVRNESDNKIVIKGTLTFAQQEHQLFPVKS